MLRGMCDGEIEMGRVEDGGEGGVIHGKSTKLICRKISSVSKSNSGQVEGCVQRLGVRLPVVMWRDGRPQGPPLGRPLIKVLARGGDFIPSWKVSKGPLVMPLILSPCSHI